MSLGIQVFPSARIKCEFGAADDIQLLAIHVLPKAERHNSYSVDQLPNST